MPARAGFSLIQLSIILTVVAVMAAAALPGGAQRSDLSKQDVTLDHMTKIEHALQGIRTADAAYPCPADGTLAKSNANFGKPIGTPGTCNGANFSDGRNVVGGTVPIRALGLPDEMLLDGWGRRFTYVVDPRTTQLPDNVIISPSQTVSYTCNASTGVTFTSTTSRTISTGDTLTVAGAPSSMSGCGAVNGGQTVTARSGAAGNWTITFKPSGAATSSPAPVSGVRITQVVAVDESVGGGAIESPCADLHIYVHKTDGEAVPVALLLISHGKNGYGAFVDSGSTTRFNSGSTDGDEEDNASLTTAFDSEFVQKSATDTFDDIVHTTDTCP